MKRLLVPFFLCLLLKGYGQAGSLHKSDRKLISSDTVMEQLEKMKDSLLSVQPAIDTTTINREAERNIQSLVRLQQENTSKQRNAALTRIAIGVGLLIVLVFGLLRRRKK